MEEKITFFGALGRMWARIFNYKDTATRKEYWFPVIFHVLICGIACGLMILSNMDYMGYGFYFCLGAFAFLGYLVFSILPWLALTVRRLRDAGKSGWWTLLILIVGVGLIILMVICTSASALSLKSQGSFDPSQNVQEEVYGPPEIFSDDDLNDEPIEDPGAFEPSQNEEPVVYGPPEMFDPAQNEEVDVYGPPEMFEGNEAEGASVEEAKSASSESEEVKAEETAEKAVEEAKEAVEEETKEVAEAVRESAENAAEEVKEAAGNTEEFASTLKLDPVTDEMLEPQPVAVHEEAAAEPAVETAEEA
ncbi:MAG: DUF805 domain-containing protein [Lachnospiraceae bacterium]|nr:DUF805 domain-containing protein [Lachnospiraceae bacterium]